MTTAITDLKSEVVDSLQKLHQANIDAAEGFAEAAKELTNEQLVADFSKWSQQRRDQAAELAKFVEINGEKLNYEKSWLAALHQSYIALKTSLSSDDDHAVLAEAERGEDHIKDAYEEVLKETPGTAVNDVIQKQYAAVTAVHDRVRDLRDACKNC